MHHVTPKLVLVFPHAGDSSTSDVNLNDEDQIWGQLAFPSYLQSKSKHKPEVCRDFDMAVTAAERRQARDALGRAASIEEDEDEDLEPETAWHTIRCVSVSVSVQQRDVPGCALASYALHGQVLHCCCQGRSW